MFGRYLRCKLAPSALTCAGIRGPKCSCAANSAPEKVRALIFGPQILPRFFFYLLLGAPPPDPRSSPGPSCLRSLRDAVSRRLLPPRRSPTHYVGSANDASHTYFVKPPSSSRCSRSVRAPLVRVRCESSERRRGA